MSAMELKAAALQEKLDRKSELIQSNAKAGITKIAIEYMVVELDMSLKPPPGFKFGVPHPKQPAPPKGFTTMKDPGYRHFQVYAEPYLSGYHF